MWKVFEQAFGTRNSESGIGGSEFVAESRSSAEEKGAMEEPAAKTPEIPAGEPSQPAGAVSALEGRVKDALRTVYDPEIPINVYELGLIYALHVEPAGQVSVQMTLTAPSCPEAQYIPGRVEQVIREIPGVTDVKVELVWEPPWTVQKMTEAARLQLGIF